MTSPQPSKWPARQLYSQSASWQSLKVLAFLSNAVVITAVFYCRALCQVLKWVMSLNCHNHSTV